MDHVVFDAEPLIAYYWDEAGSDAVEAIIDRVEDSQVTDPTLLRSALRPRSLRVGL